VRSDGAIPQTEADVAIGVDRQLQHAIGLRR
jgi:hypothetical protein